MPSWVSMTLTVHIQVRFRASRLRNRVTMCRQAATKSAGDVDAEPEEAVADLSRAIELDPGLAWPGPSPNAAKRTAGWSATNRRSPIPPRQMSNS
jgi:hypothetical protein